MAQPSPLQRFFTWVRTIFKRSQTYTDIQLAKLFGRLTSRYTERISEDEAMSATALWNGLHLIGSSLAKINKTTRQQLAPGVVEHRPDHIVNRVLKRPNFMNSSFEFWEAMGAFSALYGNSYAVIRRDGNNRPSELWMIHPSKCQFDYYPETGRGYYTFILHDRMEFADPGDMLHFKKMAWRDDGFYGLNGLDIHGGTIKGSVYPKVAANQFYANGAHIPGFLGTDAALNANDAEQIADAFNSATAGVENSGSITVLHSGVKYYPIKMSPKEAMFIEVSKHSVEEISRFLNIPLHMLSELSRASFSNIEQQTRDYLENNVIPNAMRYSEELSYKLFTTREFMSGYMVHFDVSYLTLADTKSQADFIRTGFATGALSPDDIRGIMGKNPRGDEYGQKYYTPLNMTTDPDAAAGDGGENNTDNGNQDFQPAGSEGQDQEGDG